LRITQSERNKATRLRLRHFVWEQLRGKVCVDCGEGDPVVLQFDHVDPDTKEMAIAEATNRGWKVERIAEEILKCVVRCANCHLRKTAAQFGWGEKKTAFLAS